MNFTGTINAIKGLRSASKKSLIENCMVFRETDSLANEIVRSDNLSVIISYENLETDFDAILVKMKNNPRFAQLQSRDVCIELLRLMLIDFNPMFNNLDYIIFYRINIPVLCLKNEGPENQLVGISAYIELNEIRIKIHKIADMNGTSWIAIIVAIIALTFSIYNFYTTK